MENCFVLRLKGNVDNDNLLMLGKLTLLIPNTDSQTVFILGVKDSTSPCTIKVIKGTSHLKNGNTDLGQETTCANTSGQLYGVTASGGGVITIDNVANIKVLEVYFNEKPTSPTLVTLNNIDGLIQLKNLAILRIGYCEYNIADICSRIRSEITEFTCYQTNISGDIANLAPFQTLQTLNIHQCPNLYGNIQDLGNLISLTGLRMTSDTQITGSLESFVIKQRAARVAAGLSPENSVGINFTYIHKMGITFDGEVLSNIGDSPVLTWTSNTIRLKNDLSYDKTVNA